MRNSVPGGIGTRAIATLSAACRRIAEFSADGALPISTSIFVAGQANRLPHPILLGSGRQGSTVSNFIGGAPHDHLVGFQVAKYFDEVALGSPFADVYPLCAPVLVPYHERALRGCDYAGLRDKERRARSPQL